MKRSVCVISRIGLLILFFVAIACEKMPVYYGQDSSKVYDVVEAYYNDEVTVDEYTIKESFSVFSFSDGSVAGFDIGSISIVSIDVFGYWLVNGKRTEIVLEKPGLNIVPIGDDSRRLYSIVEGYTDWTFVFGGYEIVLKKTLFAYDPDTIIRGVNHRGFCYEAPENTLPAYRLSKLRGFRYVEADIHFTADNVPVLIHDSSVARTSNGIGEVRSLTWDELQSLDFGSREFSEFAGTRIPSFAQFLDLCLQIELNPYVELKAGSREQIESLVKLVEEYSMTNRITYISFDSRLLRYVLEYNNSATVGYLTGSPLTINAIQTASTLNTGSNYVFIDSSDFGESAVSLCKAADIPLEIWTIDSRSTIKSLSSYISGVTSNCLHAGRVLMEND